MQVIIRPSSISGVLQAPASKSSTQRALAAAFLTKQRCTILHSGESEDELAAMEIIEGLGAKIERHAGKLIIDKAGKKSTLINCGESGLAARMFIPIAALQKKSITINGKGSILQRPMDFFENILPQLGVSVTANEGKLPITVKGPLVPKDIEIDGSLSSQFLTGLLMAYAATKAENVCIKVKDLKSKPYAQLTLDVLHHFNLGRIENRNFEEFYFFGREKEKPIEDYYVEADWSNSAFLLVAGAIAGPITIRGLDLTSSQADKKIVDVLMNANAGVAVEAKGIKIRPTEMQAFEFDASDSPDLFPPLAALAVYCKGSSVIAGIDRLVHKESNRLESILLELKKSKIQVEVENNKMTITGNRNFAISVHDSHNDHRIAMMNTVIALGAQEQTILKGASAVKKSYPGFFEDLKKLNAKIDLGIKV